MDCVHITVASLPTVVVVIASTRAIITSASFFDRIRKVANRQHIGHDTIFPVLAFVVSVASNPYRGVTQEGQDGCDIGDLLRRRMSLTFEFGLIAKLTMGEKDATIRLFVSSFKDVTV